MKTVLLFIALWYAFFTTADVNSTANVKSRTQLECRHGFENVDIITWKKGKDQIAYWSKNEDKIDQRYELQARMGISYLIIKEVLKEDTGNYTCIAFVVGQRKRYETIKISLEVKGNGIMVKYSLTAMVFGFLVHKMCV